VIIYGDMEDLVEELRDLTRAIDALARSNADLVAAIADIIDDVAADDVRPSGVYLSGKKS